MKKIIAGLLMFVPGLASAATVSVGIVSNSGAGKITTLDQVVAKFTNIGNVAITVLIAFAVIWIIFNVVRFIMKADSPEDRKPIQGAILWGIVGLFVILSIWGLVKILTSTFGTDNTVPVNDFPTVNTAIVQ